MSRWSESRVMVWVSLMLFASSAAVNVLQAQRLRTLLETSGSGPSLVGLRAPSLTGLSVRGESRTMLFRGGLPTIVYFFSPSCAWCERNWGNIEALQAEAGRRYRIVAVSRARGLKDYVANRQLTVDVVEGLSENDVQMFGFSGSPHTVVVSSDGQITHEWRGAFTPRIERQIENLLGVLLPGVAAGTPAASVPQPRPE